MPDSQPLKLFIIYAREDQPALLELKAHLRPLEKRGDLTVWYDGEILPGQDWDKVIKEQLATSDIVMLFISKHFFNSEYIEKEELKKALERHKKGEAMVVPVIVKPCAWDLHREISNLQVLPKDGKAVMSWGDADEAFTDVVKGVQRTLAVINEFRKEALRTAQINEESTIAAQKVEEAINFYNSGNHVDCLDLLIRFATLDYPVNPFAYTLLGYYYTEGLGYLKKDRNKALKWLLKAAEKNESVGQNNLGVWYEDEKDYISAYKWYLSSAKSGNQVAQYNLGRLYENGLGTAKAFINAINWYKKSAEQGFANGQFNLGRMYELGMGTARDIDEAIKYFRLSSKQGLQSAQEALNRLGYSE